ncbi:hypothetical protein SEA_KEELAN_91 [Gordonia phage Keelan]|nr:hypothetical protein SEA_KEELAN_91 [Gordonia phage Keelan]
MSEIQRREKWNSEDLDRWVDLIKKDELPYVDQLKMLAFCKDLYDSYADLYGEYSKLYSMYQDARQRLQKLAEPVARMIWTIIHSDKTIGDSEDELIYWAEQVESDFLE